MSRSSAGSASSSGHAPRREPAAGDGPPGRSVDMGALTVAQWLRTFVPAPVTVSRREIALGCLGAMVGIFAAAWLGHHLLAGFDPWFIAPMGASAVLLFAVPSSPLAQPWSLIGGNLCAALIGVTVARHVDDVALACGLAVSLSIGAM